MHKKIFRRHQKGALLSFGLSLSLFSVGSFALDYDGVNLEWSCPSASGKGVKHICDLISIYGYEDGAVVEEGPRAVRYINPGLKHPYGTKIEYSLYFSLYDPNTPDPNWNGSPIDISTTKITIFVGVPYGEQDPSEEADCKN